MGIIHHVKTIYSQIFPHECVLCGNSSTRPQDLCEPCHKSLPILTHSLNRCLPCIKSKLPFQGLYTLFSYEYPITRLILTLKFNEALVYSRILGELLTDFLLECYREDPLPDLIIPVPLHAKRLQERGFNQAHEIARFIARRFKLPIDTSSCSRVKSTKAQAMLTAHERQKNLRRAFHVQGDFSGKSVAILDDVITTGATITELAETLKNAGAARIDIWSIARAIL